MTTYSVPVPFDLGEEVTAPTHKILKGKTGTIKRIYIDIAPDHEPRVRYIVAFRTTSVREFFIDAEDLEKGCHVVSPDHAGIPHPQASEPV